MNIFESVFRQLNDAKIKYLVVGGIAVNLHGYTRFTDDLDILVLLQEENLKTRHLIDDLIKMKKKANRDQDILDLKSLIELKNL